MKAFFLLSLLSLSLGAIASECVEWVPGHWARSGCSDVWVSGYYSRTVTYTETSQVWVAGRWTRTECGWSYEPGHYVTRTMYVEQPPCVQQTVVVTPPVCPPVYEPACRERPRSHVSFGVAVGIPVPAPRLRALPVPVPVPFGHLPKLPKLPKLPPPPDPRKLFKKL